MGPSIPTRYAHHPTKSLLLAPAIPITSSQRHAHGCRPCSAGWIGAASIKDLTMPRETKPSIVFCHGIWADGSCFSKVIPALQAEGHQVIAAQYGLDSQAADVAMVKRTLGRVSSPAILVGHSYGGAVITAAGADDRVVGVVAIAAPAPAGG